MAACKFEPTPDIKQCHKLLEALHLYPSKEAMYLAAQEAGLSVLVATHVPSVMCERLQTNRLIAQAFESKKPEGGKP